MYDFFFDSADTEFVKNTWQQIKNFTKSHHVRGVTTNPKAMDRVNCKSLEQWKRQTLSLCEIVSDIRGDDGGVVYVQLPNCDATPADALRFAQEIATWGDGQTRVGMKIPPYKSLLQVVKVLKEYVETNVTGVADAGTALFAASYGVKYVSIIPGRMEEVGIDADAHLRQVTDSNLGNTEIIAGSMRTIEGLHRSVLLGTIPTIGGTVFGLVTQDVEGAFKPCASVSEESPHTTQKNIDLSAAFFEEMNGLAETPAKEFGLL